MINNWYIIEEKKTYTLACKRHEEVKLSAKGSDEHKEKMVLAFLINQYEEKNSKLPEVDPIELIKIRMEDFGYKANDLAREYGYKGTVSKVLNHKQTLSLTMVKKFSKILRIPSDMLTKKYALQS
jgi:HTH-type transcriptional regulator/antitoxin HigA